MRLEEINILKIIKFASDVAQIRADSCIQPMTRTTRYINKYITVVNVLYPLLQHLFVGICVLALFCLLCYWQSTHSIKQQIFNRLSKSFRPQKFTTTAATSATATTITADASTNCVLLERHNHKLKPE
jgi:uncharacterized membrane protein